MLAYLHSIRPANICEKFWYRPPEIQFKLSFVYLAVAGLGCWDFHEFIFTPIIVLNKENQQTERPVEREKIQTWKILQAAENHLNKWLREGQSPKEYQIFLTSSLNNKQLCWIGEELGK